MSKYFVKQEIADKPGEFEYVEVDDNALEVPEALVLAHPKYKEVTDESVKRRKKIQELKGKLDEAAAEPGEEPEKPAAPEQPVVPPAQPLDEEALFDKFTQRLAKQQAEREQKEREALANLQSIASKHKLGADVLPALQLAKDPEALAEILEKTGLQFDDSTGGAPSQPDKDALLGNVLKRLDLE